MERNSFCYIKLTVIIGLLLLTVNTVFAGEIEDFSSDGCSHFPDGTLNKQSLWCDCCIAHDIAYWQGGSREQKKKADEGLRTCVVQKTGNNLLANSMYYGVTVGGSPVFPVWYRWGYGWRYGRGFQSLNPYEKQQVKEKLQHYGLSVSKAFCDFDYPPKLQVIKQWQKVMNMLE